MEYLFTLGGKVRCIQCNAMSKRTKQRCKAPAIKGKTKCRTHGGNSTGPKTKAGKGQCAEAFLHAGGESFSYIPCLNNHAQWIDALADISLDHMQAWDLSAPDEKALAASRERALALGAKT